MSGPREIAILLPDLRAGGAERIHLILASEFLRRGYRVTFVLMQIRGELLEEVPDGVGLVELGARRLRYVPLPLARYLREKRPDMVLAAMWPLTVVACIAKRISGGNCRLVVAEHNTLRVEGGARAVRSSLSFLLRRVSYRTADAIIGVSRGVCGDLVDKAGLRGETISVVYNPVRSRNGSAPPDNAIVDTWKSGDAALLAVGSLKEGKDYPNLLRAFAAVRKTRPARLLILGEGALRGELEKLVVALGLSDSVLMPGFVADPYPYLEEADLFVLSSAWEGLPGVLIEALVAGLPAVATDCPAGPSEILENGKYGRLVPVADSAALAAAIVEALDAHRDRDLLRRRGAEFTVERAADQYLALLDPHPGQL